MQPPPTTVRHYNLYKIITARDCFHQKLHLKVIPFYKAVKYAIH